LERGKANNLELAANSQYRFRRSDGIAPYTKCSGGRLNDGDLSMHELIRDLEPSRLYCPTSYDVPEMRKCPDEPSCPADCSCKSATSDTIHMNCRDKQLQKVPKHGPENVVNLILEDNELTELRAREFTQYRRIQGLDLSKNKIETIDEKAFDGLVNLQKLYLYENQLTSIGPGTLNGLRGLQTIMMNSNKLKCLPADLLSDQRGSLIM
jgi:Leucine-rich repeat (LRR) protein